MTKSVYLHSLASCLGNTFHSVEASHAAGRILAPAQSYRETGFGNHHIASPDQTAYDLCHGAVTPIADKLRNITTIIYATCLPLNANIGSTQAYRDSRDVKHLMDYPASHLQADFKMDQAAVIGLNQQACTGMLGSMRLARALLLAEEGQKEILCVTADRFPDGALYEQAYNLISDGAAACIVGTEPNGYCIIATHALTNGALAQASDDETVGSYFCYTDRLLGELAQQSGVVLAEIDWIVPQNTNASAWFILSRLLGVEFDRVYFKTMRDVGHVISADNVVNLMHLEQQGLVKRGQKLLLFMAGFGLNWQAVILEKV